MTTREHLVDHGDPVQRVLDELRGIGPFFTLQIYVDERAADRWRPLCTLLTPDALRRRSEQMARHLALAAGAGPRSVEPRVAASAMQQGVVARLLSPWLGLAALGELVPVQVSGLRWIPAPGSSFALSVAAGTFDRDRVTTLEQWVSELVEHLLAPLTYLVDGSPSVLWGNTTSAVNGAVVAAGYARPDLQPTMREVGEAVISALPTRGAYTGQIGAAGFRRRSCCLRYRLAGTPTTALCGDCVLLNRKARID